MGAQIGIAANAFAIDPCLRSGFNAMLFLEGIGLLARGQGMVFNLVALAFKQPFGLETRGAKVIRHHHAI